MLDLYVCLRPVQYFKGVPSPVKRPEKVDMVIFRENTEDIYAGIEWAGGTPEAKKMLDFLEKEFPKAFAKIRFGTEAKAKDFWEAVGAKDFPTDVRVGIGIKPVSYSGTVRLVHSAISYAIQNKRKSVTLVHKGNIMKFTEGAFRDWGYAVAKQFFGAEELDGGPWCKIPEGKPGAGIVIKDAIADITLQQVLTRPEDFDVIATLNLNGDYLSDALAAQVGGIGIAPGGNINYITGHAIFEATHGTAPKYANLDKVNPGSVILVGRDDVPLHGLDRSGRSHHQGLERRDREQASDVRFRAPDGRRNRDQVLGLRRQRDRAHVGADCRAGAPPARSLLVSKRLGKRSACPTILAQIASPLWDIPRGSRFGSGGIKRLFTSSHSVWRSGRRCWQTRRLSQHSNPRLLA